VQGPPQRGISSLVASVMTSIISGGADAMHARDRSARDGARAALAEQARSARAAGLTASR